MIYKENDQREIEIKSINISERKGVIKRPILKCQIDKKGIVGDAHRGDWHRQVSFLDCSKIEKFKSEKKLNIHDGDFGENINFFFIDQEPQKQINLLDKISFLDENLVMVITQIGKKCHNDGCAIKVQTGECIMPKDGLFARIEQIKENQSNEVTLEQGMRGLYLKASYKIAIIIMSDRAYQGIYQDESGHLIQSMLKESLREKLGDFDYSILPDEKEELSQKLSLIASREDYDAVFICGGTGVGPRDITYEVLSRFCDKEIPGIMEYIRLKYGERIPNALLSRSFSGIKGKTIFYGIPGSPNAARDYVSEILKTFEHLVLMIHGIGH